MSSNPYVQKGQVWKNPIGNVYVVDNVHYTAGGDRIAVVHMVRDHVGRSCVLQPWSIDARTLEADWKFISERDERQDIAIQMLKDREKEIRELKEEVDELQDELAELEEQYRQLKEIKDACCDREQSLPKRLKKYGYDEENGEPIIVDEVVRLVAAKDQEIAAKDSALKKASEELRARGALWVGDHNGMVYRSVNDVVEVYDPVSGGWVESVAKRGDLYALGWTRLQ